MDTEKEKLITLMADKFITVAENLLDSKDNPNTIYEQLQSGNIIHSAHEIHINQNKILSLNLLIRIEDK